MILFLNMYIFLVHSEFGLKESWEKIQQHKHYKSIRTNIMEKGKTHLGHFRTAKQQMDAMVQLLHFDASKIQPLLSTEFSFQWTSEGGRIYEYNGYDWGVQEYAFHDDLRNIIRGHNGQGLFRTYQDGMKVSLQKAFDDLINSDDGNAFRTFFETFESNLMICMDALDRATQFAIGTTLSLDLFEWDNTCDHEVNLNRFMNDVIKKRICRECISLTCKVNKWNQVKTGLSDWEDAIRLSGGGVSEAQVQEYIDDYVKDNDDLGVSDDYRCSFEDGPIPQNPYSPPQAPRNPYSPPQTPQNPYSPPQGRRSAKDSSGRSRKSASNFSIIATLLFSTLILL